MNDMLAMNAQSAELRRARAAVRLGLATGTLPLAELLADPPAEILGVTLLDVLKMLRGRHADRRLWQHRLGQAALRDGINVLVTIGQSSQRTREWAVQHGQAYTHTSPRKAVA